MARRPRLNLADIPQHVIQRGNNRQATFFAEEDYSFYLDRLRDASCKYGCLVYAYVLMTNHVRLLASSQCAYGLSLMMQYVGRYFVRHINRSYQRSGTLWEGRFKANLVDTDTYFLRCCRYVEWNPVRANLVLRPEDYRWSSYRHHAFGAEDNLVSSHEGYERLGGSAHERQRVYRGLFELDGGELSEIRDSVNRGWPLGSERFKDEVEHTLQRAARPPRRGRPVRSEIPIGERTFQQIEKLL